MKKAYKTNENEDFWSPKAKHGSEMIKKALPTQRFRNAIPKRQKHYKTNGKRGFQIQNSVT